MACPVTSESTRMALLMAAGELFAEHGVEAVSTRAIAGKAGANLGMIHYYFGCKEGLLNAALDFALELWEDDPLGSYLESRRGQLKTPAGQGEALAGMVDLFFKVLFSPLKPWWCCTLAFQVLQRDLPASGRVFAKAGDPNLRPLRELYRLVTGDEDFETGYCWALAVVAGPVVNAVNPLALRRVHPDGEASPGFLVKLQAVCTRNALAGLGLRPAAKQC